MKFNPSHTLQRITFVSVFACAVTLSASAQTGEPAPATPTPTPSPAAHVSPAPRAARRTSLERDFIKNILRDERAIWTAPFHARRADARWLLPLGLSTAALVATDRYTAGALDDSDHHISHDIARFASLYGVGGTAAAFYVAGRLTHNARARETGVLGAEALIDGTIVSLSFKGLSQRPKPTLDGARGRFFHGGSSFPSGHSMSIWSVATVVAQEYSHRRVVPFAAYGLATAVALSRYTGRNHFLSDVLVGSALGYGVGRYVYRTHHEHALDTVGDDDSSAILRTRSKLFPRVSPEYNRGAREYGIGLAWSF